MKNRILSVAAFLIATMNPQAGLANEQEFRILGAEHKPNLDGSVTVSGLRAVSSKGESFPLNPFSFQNAVCKSLGYKGSLYSKSDLATALQRDSERMRKHHSLQASALPTLSVSPLKEDTKSITLRTTSVFLDEKGLRDFQYEVTTKAEQSLNSITCVNSETVLEPVFLADEIVKSSDNGYTIRNPRVSVGPLEVRFGSFPGGYDPADDICEFFGFLGQVGIVETSKPREHQGDQRELLITRLSSPSVLFEGYGGYTQPILSLSCVTAPTLKMVVSGRNDALTAPIVGSRIEFVDRSKSQ